MKIDQTVIKRIADLSCLEFQEGQSEPLIERLNAILDWVEQLNEVDIEGLEPMTSPLDITAPLRKDQVNDGKYADEIVKNAPETDEHYFVVPRIIE